MTTAPRFQAIAPSTSTASRGYQFSDGYRFARGNLAAQSAVYIVPQVEEWPYSVDLNGQSFPAGLVGVWFKYTHLDPTPTTTNEKLLIAVPSVLPAGFTHRWLRDHNVGRQTLGGVAPAYNSCAFDLSPNPSDPPLTLTPSGGGSAPSDWMIRTAEAMTPYTWLPENCGDYCYTGDFTGGGTPNIQLGNPFSFGGLYPVQYFNGLCAGMRYFRLMYEDGVGTTDNLRIRLVCDSTGGISQPADTTLDEWIWSGTGAPVTHDTGWVGPYNAPADGTKVYFGTTVDVQWGGVGAWLSSSLGSAAICGMGPRLDLPFPWTACGMDSGGAHIIAPGGVLTGTVPGY
jgi:hypothetical protein